MFQVRRARRKMVKDRWLHHEREGRKDAGVNHGSDRNSEEGGRGQKWREG